MKEKYTCTLGALVLSLSQTGPNTMHATVSNRRSRKPTDVFQRALIIRPGTILALKKQKGGKKQQPSFITVKAFAPKLQYNGRLVSSGEITTVAELT